uniref:hypothetical protein n=1 Tax=Enterococcus faecalis TaxID=1351 RepID=UPI00359C557E
MTDKKRGRRALNTSEKRITIRLDKDSEDILNKYMAKKNIDKSESIRRGIKKLREDL